MTTIHLVRSAEMDARLFSRVIDLLQAIPGPLQFRFNRSEIPAFDDESLSERVLEEEPFYSMNLEQSVAEMSYFPLTRAEASWKTLFSRCEQYRSEQNIHKDDFVILLTEVANSQNWFSAVNPDNPCDGFVHAADWKYYVECSAEFPVAYEVIALILQKRMFDGYFDFSRLHKQPIGCMNDICWNKKDITLKLRTADICLPCLELAQSRIPVLDLHHALNILESLREKMLFAQNFRQFTPPGRMLIDTEKRIFLTDYRNLEIKLRPLEKTMYLLFLRYPEGIFLSDLTDHREELFRIYSSLTNTPEDPDGITEIRERINEMTNVTSNSASQKMSKIKKVFETAIGNKLAQHYCIKGASGEKKSIALDRRLVTIE